MIAAAEFLAFWKTIFLFISLGIEGEMFSDLISFTPKFQNNFAASTTGDSKWTVREPNLEKKQSMKFRVKVKIKLRMGWKAESLILYWL